MVYNSSRSPTGFICLRPCKVTVQVLIFIGGLQVVLSVSKGNGAKPDSGMELESQLKLKVVRPESADLQQAGSLANPLPPPEILLGLKEGDRRLIIFDEKQHLVRAACLTHCVSHALPEAFLHPSFDIFIAQAVTKRV